MPGAVRGYVNRKRNESASAVDTGRGRNLTETPEALSAVADALRAGEQPCSCGARSPRWRRDQHHVLRCPTCDGVEHGQVYAVEDRYHGTEEAA